MFLYFLLPLLFHIFCFRKLAAHATGKWLVAHNLSNTFGVPLYHYSETVNTGEIWDFKSDVGRFKSCVIWSCVTGCVVTDDHVRNHSPSCKASYPRTVAYWGGGGQPPSPSDIPKALQNRAKLNPIVKSCSELLNLFCQHPKMFGKKAIKF